MCHLFSSSSSLSLSGREITKKREEEEEGGGGGGDQKERKERESRERCLSPNHPFFACPWGLVQIHGGPCGVLASVESCLFSSLFFSPSRSQRSHLFLQDIYTFLHMTDDREKERFLSTKIADGAAQSPSSVCVPLFCNLLSSLQKETESRDEFSQCDGVSSVHSREGKKRRSEEREVALLGEDNDRNQQNREEKEEDTKKRRNVFVVNPEFLTLRGFSSLIRRHALVEALSSILFQCTYTSKYIVAYAELNTPGHKKDTSSLSKATALLPKAFTGESYQKEGEERKGRDNEGEDGEEDADYILRECIQVYIQQFDNIQKVMQFYWEYYDLLIESSSSVISFLFSVVLTRGIQRVSQNKERKKEIEKSIIDT